MLQAQEVFSGYIILNGAAMAIGFSMALAVFLISWNAVQYTNNNCLLILGIAALPIGALGFIYCLLNQNIYAYEINQGMLPELWMLTRMLEAASILLALYLREKAQIYSKYWVLLLYILITVLILMFSFVEGVHINRFAPAVLLLSSAIYLYKKRLSYNKNILHLLMYAIIVAVVVNLMNATNSSNDLRLVLLIQYLLLASYYFIYRIIVVKTIKEPFAMVFMDAKQNEQRLFEEYQICRNEANIDGLTGVYNHRYLYEQIEKEKKRSDRFNTGFSLVLMDLDRFKSINDEYGHLIGDEVLRGVARIIASSTRETDIVGRYGGEEFLIILPGTKLDEAYTVAEKIRAAIDRARFVKDIHITISGGLAQYHGEPASELISLADKNLYYAKETGRNRNIM